MRISRRGLILGGLAAGGGLAVGVAWYGLEDGDAARKFAARTPGAVPLNAWLKVLPDGRVVCGVHRAEMGQGVTTALPMLLAEELDVEWSQVSFELTPVDRDYYNFAVLLRGRPLGDTTGRPGAAFAERAMRGAFHAMGLSMTISSTSVVDAWDTLRPAGAAARAMLVAAAAARWKVPPGRLRAVAGVVEDPASGRRAGYGELAAEAARQPPPEDPPLKAPGDFRLVGRPVPRLDVPDKVRGTAAYGIDTRLPNQLYAAVRHSPRLGTRIGALDNAPEVAAMAGVEGVVRLGEHAVAVVARDTWTALRGVARLSIKPEIVDPATADSAALLDIWRQALDGGQPVVVRDAEPLPPAGEGVHEAMYELPYLAHLCMEPMNCTALATDDGVTIWAPTQAESLAADVAAAVAGVGARQVTVHRTLLGGGFGRRAEMDYVSLAVAAARAFPGRPVQTVYSREEDVRHDMYRPGAVARVRGALDAQGRIAALDYLIATQSVVASYYERTPTPRGGNARKDDAIVSGAANAPYAIPALRVAFQPQDSRIPAGFWRSVGNSHNGFVMESFVDELARRAGADPVEFRLRQLPPGSPHAAVLREAAARAGWGTALAAGRGRGVALIESHDSIVAQVVEVSVSPARSLRVDRVVCVIDCRVVIHPDVVRQQMEGAIVDGLSAALFGDITVRGGGVEQSNFHDCRLLRLGESPAIEVHLLPQGGRPGGVGEPGLPGVAPALANAIYAATGERIRKLPITATLAFG